MIDWIIIGAAGLLVVSVLASRISDRFGVPVLLIFLALGMLAGSDGIGGIYFDNPQAAQSVGVVALVLILFSGGLDTEWRSVRPIVKEGLLLSTVGVLLTALGVGLIAALLLKLSIVEGLLLGAVISSTDAAAVFSVLRAKGINLKGQLKPLLEFESGSNDPMAIFLTVGLIQILTQPDFSTLDLLGSFVLQMLLGAGLGVAAGYGMLFLLNRIRLGYDGLYPVFTTALVFLTFGLTNVVGGNGFLAVYLAGIMLRRGDFIHRKSVMRFHDGLAWLMQITMFLTLGLLVFPSRLPPIMGVGLLIAIGLMFVARPIGVFLALLPSKLKIREKAFISWVGLRGAVPIILATYPLLAGLEQAELMFNVVFFVVLTSTLFQGTLIPQVARWLKVDAPLEAKRVYPLEYTRMEGLSSELKEYPIPADSFVVGKSIVELGLPQQFLIMLIARGNEFVLPSGGTVLEAGDVLLALTDAESSEIVREQIAIKTAS